MAEERFQEFWQDATGYCSAEVGVANGEGYWPAMVEFDAELKSGTILADDARTLANLLLTAAMEAENANLETASEQS